jgi:hypothetical protein
MLLAKEGIDLNLVEISNGYTLLRSGPCLRPVNERSWRDGGVSIIIINLVKFTIIDLSQRIRTMILLSDQ